MTGTLSPDHDMANTFSAHMPVPHLARRSSRSSGSQGGHRSSRIEKPKSNHNSPRTVERRKTTSNTKRYATLDDHFNMMFGLSGEEEAQEDQKDPSRPMSWHPSSAQFHVPSRSSIMSEHTQAHDWSYNYAAPSRNSAHGSDFYSLSARNSMYTEQFQQHAASNDVHRGSQDSENSCQSQPTSAYALSSFSTPATEPMPWYLQEWARKNNNEASNSRNGSSDFLPIQHPSTAEAEDEDMEEEEKELVGMGLYDLPESSLGWSSSALLEGTGKGLKLEETWQPPEEDEGDDEQDADDASSDDGSVEELPTAKESTQLPLDSGNTKPQIPGNMEGQSFFFDEDETYKTEWWFRQLKQPSVPVRDAGLGYGWL